MAPTLQYVPGRRFDHDGAQNEFRPGASVGRPASDRLKRLSQQIQYYSLPQTRAAEPYCGPFFGQDAKILDKNDRTNGDGGHNARNISG